MQLKHLLSIGVVIIQLSFLNVALRAQLLNVDFGSETSRAKVGFAATGQSSNDFWNLYSRDDGNGGYRTFGTVSNLKRADGTVSAVGLTVINAPGAWLNGAADPMYDAYLYPFDGGNITVTMTNLPAGSYDVFLYGHGGPGVDSANSVFRVVSGNNDYGTKATTTNSGWASPVWEEGQQYVVFRDVAVANAGGSVTVTVFPGAYGQAFISGMQVVEKSSPPPPPVAGPLLNVDFGIGTSSAKAGFAATGQSAADYWNLYSRDDGRGGYRTFGAVSNLKRADGTVTAVAMTVRNAPGAWDNGTTDPMYKVYLYPFDGGNVAVTMTNLPAGTYDVFLYGHGGPGVDSANSVFKVASGSSDYGSKATTITSGWISSLWQEGQQYVVFRDVVVANAGMTVTVLPGVYGQAFISGMQLVQISSSPPPPPPVAGPLLNVAFGSETSIEKVGFAATGQSPNDYWNLYSRNDGSGGYRTFGALNNLKMADRTVSAVGLTVANAPGAWRNGTADPMYDVYLYPFDGGNITVAVTNLPVGSYDLFLYGHGGPGVDTANSVFQVVSSGSDYGTKGTTTSSGWSSPVWQEEQQYVVFRDVAVVDAAGAVTITVLPGAYGQAFLSGMQIVQRSSTPGCVTILPGLVSWWKGDGNANDATGAHNSTFMNGITFTDGRVGQAFEFNGIDSQVKFGNTVGNFDTNDFTVEFWIRTTATRHESVIEKWPTCGYASMWGIRIGGMAPWSGPGRLEAEMYSDTVGTDQNAISAGRPINDGLFHHVALVRIRNNLVFYIDGVQDVVTQILSGSISRINNTASLTVGKSVCVGVDGTSPFTGQLDELAVYNRALPASEIQEIYNAGGAGKCPPAPVGPFTNGSFESPALAPGSGSSLPSGSTAITGWRVEGPGMGWQNGASFGVNPVDGYQHVGFNGGNMPPGQATIAQTFTTTVGQSYDVSFNVGRTGSGSGTMSLLAEVTSSSNALLGSLSVVAPDSPGYGPVRGFAFAATTSASTLTFRDTSSATFAVDPLLDNVSVVPIQSCVPSPRGLVSWWSGDGNANDTQDSNNGTPQNGTSFTAGKVGQAFSFDGVDDQVLVLHNANQNTGSQITIDAWVNPSSSGHGRTILQKRSASNVGGYVFETLGQPFGPDNGLQFVIMIGGTYYSCMTTNSVLTLNTWQHVAATYDGSAMRIYVNGVERASAAVSGAIDAVTDPIVIGRNVVAPDHAWHGLIDEVDLFNRALPSSEIASIYNASSGGKCVAQPTCIQPPSGLVAWWPAKANANDIVLGNNGALRGDASYGEGMVGQAFKFDGNGDGVLIGNPPSLRLQNFTIEGWIKRASATQVSTSSIFGEIVGYGWGGYVLGFFNDGRLFLSKHGVSYVDSARPITDTAWHHVAVTKAEGSVVFYIDGASETTQSYDATFEFSTDLVIGAVNNGMEASFLGSIDELSIYNRALTAREVQAIHNAAGAGKCAPLPLTARALAHWKFDETSGPVAYDSAGSYDGALSINGASFVTNGIAGNAMSVTKSANGFVDMGNVLGMESGDFSVTAWIKMIPGDMSQSSVIVSKQQAGYANGYLLAVNRSEGPTGGYAAANKAWFYDSDYHGEEVTSTTSVNEGNWHQIVGVYVAGAAKYIYVDGAPAEARKASRPIVGNPGKFVVGGVDFDGIPGGLFTGLIDEVQIYNYALSSSEVDFLFQNPGQEIAPHDFPPGNWQLNAIAGIGGTISRNPDLAKYTYGAIVTVTAVPNAGFTFSGWSGDASGTSNTTTISMNGNKTVTASFREIPARLLAVVNPEAGQEGASITVPITLTSQGEVGGMSFVLHFDPAYLRNPSLRWASVVGSALNQVGYEIPGQVRATFALPATAVPAGTKLVANVSFLARSVPFTLSTELGLEILDASKTTGDPITSGSYTQSGSAQILARRAVGDNNANDRLDIGDASIIQRLLTGLDPVRSWDVTGNDVNASSRLDSGDVIRVLRVVVGLDPQPQLQSQGLAKSGLQKSGPVPAQVDLSLDKPSAQPGDSVKLQVRLTGISTSIEGAMATLDYPTNALRLLNAQSQRTGSLVPSSALAVWNVAPAQTDYALQSGRVLVAMSSATPWPTNEGVLAEFMFQVQSGQTTQYRWPIRVSNVEVTEGGFDLQSLPDAETYFIGRNPVPPSLSSASSGWSSNGFRLSLDGESGVTYSIEVSSDLVTWLPLTRLTTDTNGTLSFVDESATGSTKRFYRAKQQ